MAEYDTSIRVSTKVDSTELDKVAKTFKDIEGKADDAKEKVEELDKVSSGVKTEDYEKQAKALEKVNTELDKNIRKLCRLMDRITDLCGQSRKRRILMP